MKKSIVILSFLLIAFYAKAQDSQESSTVNSSANISWISSSTHDLGTIKKGIPVISTFEFTNSGNEPLIISEVKSSCGCTTVDYSKQPVSPGSKGFIKASYNANSLGIFSKSITVTTNTANKTEVLILKGQVIE